MAGVDHVVAEIKEPVENSDYDYNATKVTQANNQMVFAPTIVARNTLAASSLRPEQKNEIVPSGHSRRTISCSNPVVPQIFHNYMLGDPSESSGRPESSNVHAASSRVVSELYLTTTTTNAAGEKCPDKDEVYLTTAPSPCPSFLQILSETNASHAPSIGSLPYPRPPTSPNVNTRLTLNCDVVGCLGHVPITKISNLRSNNADAFFSHKQGPPGKSLPVNHNTACCIANQSAVGRLVANQGSGWSAANHSAHTIEPNETPQLGFAPTLPNTSVLNPPNKLTQQPILDISLHSINREIRPHHAQLDRGETAIYENSSEGSVLLPPELPPRPRPPRPASIPSRPRSNVSSNPYHYILSDRGYRNCARAKECRKWFTCVGVMVALMAVGAFTAVSFRQRNTANGETNTLIAETMGKGERIHEYDRTTDDFKSTSGGNSQASQGVNLSTSTAHHHTTTGPTSPDTTTTTTTTEALHCPDKFYCWQVRCPPAVQGGYTCPYHCSRNSTEMPTGPTVCCYNVKANDETVPCLFQENKSCTPFEGKCNN